MPFAQPHRITASKFLCLSGIVVLSITVPLAVTYWSLLVGLSGKPFGAHSQKIRSFQRGCVKDGELWFPVFELPKSTEAPPSRMRVHRLNLETGDEQETEFGIDGNGSDWGNLIWIADQLYFYSDRRRNVIDSASVIYHLNGKAFIELDSNRLKSSFGVPFEFEGRLTFIESPSDGRFFLVSWIDGKWTDGREILLPGDGRSWFDDLQHNRRVLLPRTSALPATIKPATFISMNIIEHGQGSHLMFHSANPSFTAYRHGFEFADENRSEVSALAPANTPSEVSGWEPVSSLIRDDCGVTMSSSRDALFLITSFRCTSSGYPANLHIIRRDQFGNSQELSEAAVPPRFRSDDTSMMIAASPSEITSYVIRYDLWAGLSIARIDRDSVLAPHVVKAGHEREYIRHWSQVVVGGSVAWLLHIAILVVGVEILTRRDRSESIRIDPNWSDLVRFGAKCVFLASPIRRAVAFLLDITIGVLVLALFYLRCCESNLSQLNWPSESQLASYLYFHLEEKMYYDMKGGLLMQTFPARFYFSAFLPLRRFFGEQLFSVVSMAICLQLVKSFFEGRYGITPGKWLLNIRTVRSTLRPCGFARQITRDTLNCVDFPFLLTPLPAAISMIFSDSRQRLGDRVADTIVIRANSGQSRDSIANPAKDSVDNGLINHSQPQKTGEHSACLPSAIKSNARQPRYRDLLADILGSRRR